ncbi:hypothetical protein P261_00962 [Lachnospiraceae bacterium TWA4]|nr:hypothetical protein P261_00962 [Lachnospiraceae bacterium TWA4]
MKTEFYWFQLVSKIGSDILSTENMQLEKQFMQHGNISVFMHSVLVACLALKIAHYLHLKVDEQSMVRGALLHDYFLYDWHIPDKSHNLHGFTHAGVALQNANRDFDLNEIEQDVIKKHMFPLNITPPKYKESILVCIADKISAFLETFHLVDVTSKEVNFE